MKIKKIKLNEAVLIPDQNAFMAAEGDAFYALAHDANENKYMIRWDVLPDWDGVDGGNACDWDNPAGATLTEKGHVALVDEDAIDELNSIAREGVQVLKPGELRDWLADMADNSGICKYFDNVTMLTKYVVSYIDADADIINPLVGDGYGVDVNNCIPVVVDDANLDGVYSIKALGATPSRELFIDRIKADQLIADVPLYDVTVDGKQIVTLGDGFHWDDGELLWQAMSEELTDLVPDGDEDRLNDWQNLPDDDIETLLQSAKEEGFINDYDFDEAEK
ncbi:hypothetical protein PO250_02140 [Limosilactobacillus mucosae]|uniref:Uncharacterized protein n=1 Tax=Limosilactobacillus mucosae TaxID=97478 RepID=A0AAJ1M8E0_LIMMU|nr:hypothetical protein [Limosilactobacillus mucosae]MDC2829137.1 hypothetical protein [Limosilactobacillus mucosae]